MRSGKAHVERGSRSAPQVIIRPAGARDFVEAPGTNGGGTHTSDVGECFVDVGAGGDLRHPIAVLSDDLGNKGIQTSDHNSSKRRTHNERGAVQSELLTGSLDESEIDQGSAKFPLTQPRLLRHTQ